ncbi:MAG: FAD-dependent oxidoreductase [Oscillospiraceae bacterium]
MREKIVELANLIRSMPDAPLKETAPEYYGLACVVTDEMADVALKMDLRQYMTTEAIAERCGKSVEETYEMMRLLEDVGIVESKTTDGKDEFIILTFVPGVFELMVADIPQVEAHPEIARAFEEYTRIRMGKLVPNVPRGYGPMRVIPIQTALDGQTRIASHEEITYWLDKYSPSISVGDCECRVSRRLVGEGCGHLAKDMCVIVGPTAESTIRTGKTRRITKQEALDIFKKAEENGLMHQVTNIDGPNKIFAICNCCRCSCFALRTSQYFNTPNMSNCNYVAKIDTENCVACGQCIENCPGDALKLGQKICTTTPIVVPKTLGPDDHEWGREQWNPEYRDNRVTVAETGTAPCKTACPAHIAVQGYIKLASQGKYLDALELIKKENPFPAVCGRICPHNCENECTRSEFDLPLAIDEIKKFIADQELKSTNRFIPAKRHDYSDKNVAVIGSGPAGLSCAYYLALDGYSVTVFEKEEKLGGMLTLGIPSFRLEKNVIEAEIDVLRALGVKFQTGYEIGVDTTIKKMRTEGFKAFYLAIGAQAGKKLGLEGEEAEGVIAGVDFLKKVNLGHGEKLSGNVIVIGGGNVAIDVARTATRQGAGAVKLYCLESHNEMPALPEELDEAQAEKIAINNGWGPKRIITENGRVTGVEFKKCVSVFDDGKFAPKYDESATTVVPADYVLLSVGQSIAWGNLLKYTAVETGRGNTAIADELTYQTAQPDIFVGGDVFTGPKFAIDAIAAGKQAAISIHRFVQIGQSLTIGRDRTKYHPIDKDNIDKAAVIAGFDNTARQKPAHDAKKDKTFEDARLTFTEEQLKRETARCLGCGATIIDTDKCLGCGLCTTKCKFDAIHLEKIDDVNLALYEESPMVFAARFVEREEAIAAREAAENKD